MKVGSWVKSNIDYGRELVESGIEGAQVAGRRVLQEGDVVSELADAAVESWKPALLCGMIGAIVGFLSDDRKMRRGMLVGGAIGASVGFIGGVAWESRQITKEIAKGAAKHVSARRDSRWLEENPIDYA